ncbi:metal-dependent hydrolase [Halorussus salinisoli]|uniref:metal-dependent hydrolase n=1 Tax=Halorussus salinisoli TaxID=2558242 RepID=UPI0010C20316|nr:metal-dependent hydrolase [Halorussus salinisoli]
MPDLLAHALIAYTIARLLSWRYDWLSSASVTVVMAGAFIPDLMKMRLLIRSGTVEHLLGLPFSWSVFHTAGGTLVAILIGVVIVDPNKRQRIFALLSIGAASHLLVDGLLLTPSGHSYAMFWPLTRYHPPTPGWYLSTQPGPTIVTLIVAMGIWLLTCIRRRKMS